jgi:hypothetical protein
MVSKSKMVDKLFGPKGPSSIVCCPDFTSHSDAGTHDAILSWACRMGNVGILAGRHSRDEGIEPQLTGVGLAQNKKCSKIGTISPLLSKLAGHKGRL